MRNRQFDNEAGTLVVILYITIIAVCMACYFN